MTSPKHVLAEHGWYALQSRMEDSQCQGSNEISIGEIQPSIAFGEVPRGSVKRKISSKGNSVVSNHTREVDNGICSESNACANSSILMLVLELHLFNKLHRVKEKIVHVGLECGQTTWNCKSLIDMNLRSVIKEISHLARPLIRNDKAKDSFETRSWFINSNGGKELQFIIWNGNKFISWTIIEIQHSELRAVTQYWVTRENCTREILRKSLLFTRNRICIQLSTSRFYLASLSSLTDKHFAHGNAQINFLSRRSSHKAEHKPIVFIKLSWLTLALVSTFTSVVMFLFFNWVLTSANNSSPFLIPVEVRAWNLKTQNTQLYPTKRPQTLHL